MEYEQISVGDPMGRVFYCDDEVYRGINKDYEDAIRAMFECGLIDKLNSLGMIPYTQISNKDFENYALVLHHERIYDPSYMQEWTFSMLKDAALLVLRLEKVLLQYDYNLKDCHCYNVMFKNNKPVFVDICSFIKFESVGWALREFYAYYDQLLQIFIEAPSIARERITSRFNIGVRYNNYYLKGMKDGKSSFKNIDDQIVKLSLISNKDKLIEIIENEEKKIKNYVMNIETVWGNYQNGYTDEEEKITFDSNIRFKKIVSICKNLEINSVLELAANQGILSRMIAKLPCVKTVISTDYDEQAMDSLYIYLKNRDNDFISDKIHPMLYDITSDFNPFISLKKFEDRVVSDVVIALALTHHLILSQHIAIDSFFDKIYRLTQRYFIVEFMPLGLWDGYQAPPVPTWYTEDWFIEHLKRKFKILYKEEILTNRVLIVAEKLIKGEIYD